MMAVSVTISVNAVERATTAARFGSPIALPLSLVTAAENVYVAREGPVERRPAQLRAKPRHPARTEQPRSGAATRAKDKVVSRGSMRVHENLHATIGGCSQPINFVSRFQG
jgi:hypothetical protein